MVLGRTHLQGGLSKDSSPRWSSWTTLKVEMTSFFERSVSACQWTERFTSAPDIHVIRVTIALRVDPRAACHGRSINFTAVRSYPLRDVFWIFCRYSAAISCNTAVPTNQPAVRHYPPNFISSPTVISAPCLDFFTQQDFFSINFITFSASFFVPLSFITALTLLIYALFLVFFSPPFIPSVHGVFSLIRV